MLFWALGPVPQRAAGLAAARIRLAGPVLDVPVTRLLRSTAQRGGER